MKTPKASGALRRAPDPMPRYARFAHPTPLHYLGKIGRTRAGPPPLDQILDPLLPSSWCDPCTVNKCNGRTTVDDSPLWNVDYQRPGAIGGRKFGGGESRYSLVI